MGYNLSLACLTCRERAFVYRGSESVGIKQFGSLHWSHRCSKVCAIDNGYHEPDWMYDEAWREISLPAEDGVLTRVEQTQQEIKDFVRGDAR